MIRPVKYFFLLWVAILLLGLGAGCQTRAASPTPVSGPAGGLGLIDEAWHILEEDYVNPDALDREALAKEAIRGLLQGLNDPYTSYLGKEDYTLWQASFHGSFEGIGAMVSMEDGQFTVIAPLAGSPAERAGVRAGDRVLEVDGKPTQGLNLAEAILLVRGPRGSRVTLTILHPGETEPVSIEIVREKIDVQSVTLEMKGDIAHIRLSTFGERTEAELISALEGARSQGARGMILDMRHNPGGLLDTAVAVASQFLEKGVVLYQVDRDQNRTTFEVRPGGRATRIPLAVLVDKASASASEVVAGALQDRGRAILIGTTTLGKGSINNVRVLSDGSALIITTARWLTPQGRLIEGQGLAPDIPVELTQEDRAAGRDPQLDRALEYLRGQIRAAMP